MYTYRYVDVRVGSDTFRGRLLDDRAPTASESLWAQLPVVATMLLDVWSGFMARVQAPIVPVSDAADTHIAIPHPGLIAWEPRSGDLTICYGQGRMRDGLGPLATIPLVELGGDLSALVRLGSGLQYNGSLRIEISHSGDQESLLSPAPAESAHVVTVELDGAVATATVLTSTAPVAARSFRDSLPLIGSATSTFLSGPLVRFRADDGQRGVTLNLEAGPDDTRHTFMWPGYVYYRPERPQGIRMTTTEPALMADYGGQATPVIPVARFVEIPATFSDNANRTIREGGLPLIIRAVSGGDAVPTLGST